MGSRLFDSLLAGCVVGLAVFCVGVLLAGPVLAFLYGGRALQWTQGSWVPLVLLVPSTLAGLAAGRPPLARPEAGSPVGVRSLQELRVRSTRQRRWRLP